MFHYLVRRLLLAVLVVLGVSTISFGLLFLGGDPATSLAGENWTRQQIEEFRVQMGFDRPWYIQYFDFLSNAVRGDFGSSLNQHQPVFELIAERLPATLQLTGTALLISISLSIPIGVISAAKRNSLVDRIAMLFALAGQSMPVFWVGTMLILLFGVQLQWLPIAGKGGFEHMILPAIALGLLPVARNARLIRSSMLEVLDADYVRTARAKGLGQRVVIMGHAFKNALLPIVTIFGLDVGNLLSGAVITETIFAWPGLGRMIVEAVFARDIPLVQASVILLSATFVMITLVVDVLYGYLDPKVRFE